VSRYRTGPISGTSLVKAGDGWFLWTGLFPATELLRGGNKILRVALWPSLDDAQVAAEVCCTGKSSDSSPYQQTTTRQARGGSHPAAGVGINLPPKRNGTEMARPRTPSTAKPAQQRNTARDKMRMGYDRTRRDIKRTEAEQTKAAAAQTGKRGPK
jgi:hypothetical protein